jgi:DnaJ family protein C protein 13
MSADKLMGPKVRIAMSKLLPEIFLDAMKKAPETGVQMYEMDQENPELIWNDASRRKLKFFLNDLVTR